jgi:DNA polymerase III delta prime subunit
MLYAFKITEMNNNIELRDFFAAELMSGKVDDFYSQAHRENLAGENETENWKQVSADEATNRRIERAAKNAYKIADALLKARG